MPTLADIDVENMANAASSIGKESIVLMTMVLLFVGTIALMVVLANLWGKHGKPALDTSLAIAKEKNTLVQGIERMQAAASSHVQAVTSHVERIERVADRLEEHQCGSGTINRVAQANGT